MSTCLHSHESLLSTLTQLLSVQSPLSLFQLYAKFTQLQGVTFNDVSAISLSNFLLANPDQFFLELQQPNSPLGRVHLRTTMAMLKDGETVSTVSPSTETTRSTLAEASLVAAVSEDSCAPPNTFAPPIYYENGNWAHDYEEDYEYYDGNSHPLRAPVNALVSPPFEVRFPHNPYVQYNSSELFSQQHYVASFQHQQMFEQMTMPWQSRYDASNVSYTSVPQFPAVCQSEFHAVPVLDSSSSFSSSDSSCSSGNARQTMPQREYDDNNIETGVGVVQSDGELQDFRDIKDVCLRLQDQLVEILRASPHPLPLASLTESFKTHTCSSFDEAYISATSSSPKGVGELKKLVGGASVWLLGFLTYRSNIFRVVFDARAAHLPIVSLVHQDQVENVIVESAATTLSGTAAGTTPVTTTLVLPSHNAVVATCSSTATVLANVRLRRPCYFWSKGLCKKGDKCTYSHDTRFDSASAPVALPSNPSSSTNAPLCAAETAAVDLICSLLPSNGQPMLPSILGSEFNKQGLGTWAEYSRSFTHTRTGMQEWMERHPNRIVVDKSHSFVVGQVFVRRAIVEREADNGTPTVSTVSIPYTFSDLQSDAIVPSDEYVDLGSPLPSTATILGWVCSILLVSRHPITLTFLGQAMRRRHGLVFVSTGSAAQQAVKATRSEVQSYTLKAFLRAHLDIFALECGCGDEINVQLLNRKAASAAAAAAAAAKAKAKVAVTATNVPSALITSSSAVTKTTPQKSYHATTVSNISSSAQVAAMSSVSSSMSSLSPSVTCVTTALEPGSQSELHHESSSTSSTPTEVAPPNPTLATAVDVLSEDTGVPPLSTHSTSSTQRTVRMQVHVNGRAAPLCVNSDCVAELREELAMKLGMDENELGHAYFSLRPWISHQPPPPALTDPQLWALPKNSAVFVVL